MYYVIFALVLVAAIASVVLYGYPALITVALAGVVLAFVFMLGLTSESLFSKNS